MKRETTCAVLTSCIALVLSGVVIATLSSPACSQQPQAIQTNHGYLFIDGQYIQPPYDIRCVDRSVIINGQNFEASFFDVSSFERQGAVGKGRSRRRMGTQHGTHDRGVRGSRAATPLARLSTHLNDATNGGIVVLFEQKKPLVLDPLNGGNKLLATLVGDTSSDVREPDQLTPQDQATWDRLVFEFQPNAEFASRVSAEFKEHNEAAMEGDRAAAANWLVSKVSYPLTVFAMVVVVLAFGHLLSTPPALDVKSEDGVTEQQVVVKSLVIIALFSTLDLVWTLVATNAGSMRELNPLGSRLIEDPAFLVAFKLIATATSIGILYSLHRRPVAQIASWWCCLLLTLLTARWVVFQSMFA